MLLLNSTTGPERQGWLTSKIRLWLRKQLPAAGVCAHAQGWKGVGCWAQTGSTNRASVIARTDSLAWSQPHTEGKNNVHAQGLKDLIKLIFFLDILVKQDKDSVCELLFSWKQTPPFCLWMQIIGLTAQQVTDNLRPGRFTTISNKREPSDWYSKLKST